MSRRSKSPRSQKGTSVSSDPFSPDQMHRIRGSARSAAGKVSGLARLQGQSNKMAQRLNLPADQVWLIFESAFCEAGGKL